MSYKIWIYICSALIICIILNVYANIYSRKCDKYVNEQINIVMKSKLYEKSSLSKRKELAYCLLLQLENSDCIKNVLYDNTNHLFSFQYLDGTLGGWKLVDFKSHSDNLPIN